MPAVLGAAYSPLRRLRIIGSLYLVLTAVAITGRGEALPPAYVYGGVGLIFLVLSRADW